VQKQQKSEAEKIGGKFTVCWTFGKCNAIGILEAPSDNEAMELELKLGSLGNVRTTTVRAFIEEEIASIVGKMS
jgi:uncharacterized protein with GYD domain